MREDPYILEESYQPPPFTLHAQNNNYTSARYFPKLPIFTGKIEEWDAFWLQFTICAEALNLNSRDFAKQLLLSLKGTAMTFVAGLDMDTVHDPRKLVRALKARFCHQVPAQTHRAALANLQKSSTETLQDFASKVQAIMTKAYPDIEGTETFTQLAIQHFLNGIPDQDLSFEVVKLSPRSLAEATDLLIWLESCKQSTSSRRTHDIRCVIQDFNTEDEEEIYQTYDNYYSYTDEDYEEPDLRCDRKQRVPVQDNCKEDVSMRCPKNQPMKNLNFNGLSLMAKPQPKA